jgi:predicted nucleic-acid-binding Zn-ribbon protein
MLKRWQLQDVKRRINEFTDKALITELLDTIEKVERKETIHVVCYHDGYVEVWGTGRCVIMPHEIAPDEEFDSTKLPVEYAHYPIEVLSPRVLGCDEWIEQSVQSLGSCGAGANGIVSRAAPLILRRMKVPQRRIEAVVAEELTAMGKQELKEHLDAAERELRARAESESCDGDSLWTAEDGA